MPKENLTELERLVVALQKLRENKTAPASQREFAASLLSHYMSFKTLSTKQIIAAQNTLRFAKRRRPKRKETRTYYLYAIVGGTNVKIGFSHSPKERLKALQTGNREHLKLYWTFPVGKSRVKAKNQEKKLHRFCKKYRVRGEWFTNECLPLLMEFKPKKYKTED